MPAMITKVRVAPRECWCECFQSSRLRPGEELEILSETCTTDPPLRLSDHPANSRWWRLPGCYSIPQGTLHGTSFPGNCAQFCVSLQGLTPQLPLEAVRSDGAGGRNWTERLPVRFEWLAAAARGSVPALVYPACDASVSRGRLRLPGRTVPGCGRQFSYHQPELCD